MSKKAVLIIMDGYGLAAPSRGNAIYVANTPNLDKLFAENPHTILQASGLDGFKNSLTLIDFHTSFLIYV